MGGGVVFFPKGIYAFRDHVKIEDGVVMFVTSDELQGGQTLAFYEVRDIIHPVPNFPGREININPSGINVAQDIFGDEEIEEREGLVVTGDALEGLIRDNIAVALHRA